MRSAVRDVHRSAFDRDAGTVALTVADTGLLLCDAVAQLRPELARRIPPGLTTRLSAVSAGEAATGLDVVQEVHRVRSGRWIALGAAVLFALLCVLVAPGRRAPPAGSACARGGRRPAGAARRGGARAGHGRHALRAVLRVWLEPLAAYGVALGAAGLVVVLAAACGVRRVPVLRAGGGGAG